MIIQLFTKKLSKTDVEKRLAIPTSTLRAFKLNGAPSAVVRTEDVINGRVWQFCCTTRTKGNYSKPVLSRGWLPFVRCKKLRRGDRVSLHKDDDEDEAQVPYKIEVERKIKLFGRLVWGKV